MAKLKAELFNAVMLVCICLVAADLSALLPAAAASKFPRQNAIVRAVEKVSPAVVNVSSEQQVKKRQSPFSGFGMDPFFDNFFKDFFDHDNKQGFQRSSLGSGVIIDGMRGFILTNAHVIENRGTITVVLNDKRQFEAKIIGADPDSDLAVLKIESDEKLPAIEMGNSHDLMIGETVIAIGNPFGFSHTVTTGVISAMNRSIRTENRVFRDFIQTDASINPGNSGGPLLNINGELIGINTAIYAKAQGIGFAIPIDRAERIIADLIRYGEVVPAWIGIDVQSLDLRLAGYLKFPRGKDGKYRGVMVREVQDAGPAQKAGISPGDVILALGGKSISTAEEYRSMLRNYAAGDTVEARLWRHGNPHNVSMTAKVFPDSQALDLAYRLLGIEVDDINRKNRQHYRISAKNGVVISHVNQRYYLARIGVAPGDVIRKIDEAAVRAIEDFKKAIVKYRQKGSLVILLQRSDQLYYITVKL